MAAHSPHCHNSQNTNAPSSDEEEDMANLQLLEQKLLEHDPTFTQEHTHASLSAQRSALLSAFKPQYDDTDIEGASIEPRFSRR